MHYNINILKFLKEFFLFVTLWLFSFFVIIFQLGVLFITIQTFITLFIKFKFSTTFSKNKGLDIKSSPYHLQKFLDRLFYLNPILRYRIHLKQN